MKKIILIIALIFTVNCNGYYQGCAKIDMSEEQILQKCGEPSSFNAVKINNEIINQYTYTKVLISYTVTLKNNKVTSVSIW